MKLIEFLNCFDIIGSPMVTIWHEDDEETPLYKGELMNTPYWILDCELDFSGGYKPVNTSITKNKYDKNSAELIIQVKG